MKHLLTIAATLLGITLTATSQPVAGQPASSSAACKDTLVTNFFRRSAGWVSSDGAITIPLSDGRTLWLMGDSHIDDYDPATATVNCLFQVRNAALIQPRRNWEWQHTRTLIGTGPGIRSFLKNDPDDNHFIWPGAGIQLKDTVYVYCANMKNAKSAIEGFGFAHSGPDCMAKLRFPDLEVVGYDTLQNFDEIGFGIGFIKKGHWVYVYGQKLAGLTNKLYVARFFDSRPGGAWTFYTGTGWSDNITDIQPIAAQNGMSGTFQVSQIKNTVLLVSSDLSIGCDGGKSIYTATSASLTGPFTSPLRIYTIDDTLQGHYPFFYSVVAHPEFLRGSQPNGHAPDSQALLFTYCINGYGTCVPICHDNRMNPDYYRPKAFRVPLSAIGIR
jgi:hypothetical protein